MSRPHIRKLVRYYCLLDAELNRKGRPFTEEEESKLFISPYENITLAATVYFCDFC